jgi:hypothetical protein
VSCLGKDECTHEDGFFLPHRSMQHLPIPSLRLYSIIGSSFEEIGFVDFIINILPCIFFFCVPISVFLVLKIYKFCKCELSAIVIFEFHSLTHACCCELDCEP